MRCSNLRKILTNMLSINLGYQTKVELVKSFSTVKNKDCFRDVLESFLSNIIDENPYFISSKALIHLNLGEKDRVLEEIKRLLNVLKTDSSLDPWSKTRFLICISRIYYMLNKISEAKTILEEALETAHSVPDKSDRSDALKHVAITYALLDSKDRYVEVVDSILFVQRKIEAIFEIMDVLCSKGREEDANTLIEYLPPEWKIIALSKSANCYFKQGENDKARILAEKILKNTDFLENRNLLAEVYRNILPIMIYNKSLSELNGVINKILDKIGKESNIVKIIDTSSLKLINPVKLLGIELLLMEHLELASSVRDKIDIQSLLLIIDLLLDKDIDEQLNEFIAALDKMEEYLKELYIQKFSNYITTTFGENVARC